MEGAKQNLSLQIIFNKFDLVEQQLLIARVHRGI